MKDFAKSIRTMNSNKEEIIKKKKEAGATLKVDNGQKLEFSDGTTYVKTSFSDDYREAKNYTGNQKVGNEAIVLKDGDVWIVLYANETKSKEFDTEAEARAFAKQVGNRKVGNKYEWTTRNGELQYFDYSVPFGGHKKGSVEKTSGGYTGYKMNGSIIISKKEFQTEEEAKKYVENKKVGNREISLSASNSGELNLHDDGIGFMYDPVELGRYEINGKSDAMAAVRELEKLKREAEAKVRDCQKFIDTLKQWANGLK